MTRTIQSLLAERRANAVELMHERDATAREMLIAHITYLDLLVEDFYRRDEWEGMETMVEVRP